MVLQQFTGALTSLHFAFYQSRRSCRAVSMGPLVVVLPTSPCQLRRTKLMILLLRHTIILPLPQSVDSPLYNLGCRATDSACPHPPSVQPPIGLSMSLTLIKIELHRPNSWFRHRRITTMGISSLHSLSGIAIRNIDFLQMFYGLRDHRKFIFLGPRPLLRLVTSRSQMFLIEMPTIVLCQ
jgi:hypothetical protein